MGQRSSAPQQLKVTWNTVPLPNWATFNDDLRHNGAVDRPGDPGLGVPERPERRHGARRTPAKNRSRRPTSTRSRCTARWAPRRRLRCPGEHRDRLVVDAGDLSVALDARDRLEHAAAEHPLRVRRGLRLLRAERADDVSLDAAVISQAVGKPVRVAYMRSDEHAWENYGQAYTVKIAARVRQLERQGEAVGLEARCLDVDPRRPARAAREPALRDPDGLPGDAAGTVDHADAEPAAEQRRQLQLGAALHRSRGTPDQPHRAPHLHVRTAPLPRPDPEHVRERDVHGRARVRRRRRSGQLPNRQPAGPAPDRRDPARRDSWRTGSTGRARRRSARAAT